MAARVEDTQKGDKAKNEKNNNIEWVLSLTDFSEIKYHSDEIDEVKSPVLLFQSYLYRCCLNQIKHWKENDDSNTWHIFSVLQSLFASRIQRVKS